MSRRARGRALSLPGPPGRALSLRRRPTRDRARTCRWSACGGASLPCRRASPRRIGTRWPRRRCCPAPAPEQAARMLAEAARRCVGLAPAAAAITAVTAAAPAPSQARSRAGAGACPAGATASGCRAASRSSAVILSGMAATTFAAVAAMRRLSTSNTLSMDTSIWATAVRSLRELAPLPSMARARRPGSPERRPSNTSDAHAFAARARAARIPRGLPGTPSARPSRFRSLSAVTNGAKTPIPWRPSVLRCRWVKTIGSALQRVDVPLHRARGALERVQRGIRRELPEIQADADQLLAEIVPGRARDGRRPPRSRGTPPGYAPARSRRWRRCRRRRCGSPSPSSANGWASALARSRFSSDMARCCPSGDRAELRHVAIDDQPAEGFGRHVAGQTPENRLIRPAGERDADLRGRDEVDAAD